LVSKSPPVVEFVQAGSVATTIDQRSVPSVRTGGFIIIFLPVVQSAPP
jgi:hypothetical protein